MKRAALLLLLALVALSGCQAAQEPAEPQTQETQTVEPETQETQTAEPAGPRECKAETQSSIEESISRQTSAFGEGDFETAYSIASPSFQRTVTLEGFIDIISGSYGPLIESSELAYRNCMVDGSEAIAIIDVRFIEAGNVVYGLRYLMVNFEGTWRVDGASNLQVVGEGT